jgi:AAA15 family ATPase/GTPase
MYIKYVELENIKCFLDGDSITRLDLRHEDGLYPGWTVVAGNNGSGKTTFLRSLAFAVCGPEYSRQLQPSFREWIRYSKNTARVKVVLENSLLHKNELSTEDIRAELKWNSVGNQEPILTSSPSRNIETKGWTNSWSEDILEYPIKENFDIWNGPWSQQPKGWFIAGYRVSKNIDRLNSTQYQYHVKRLANLFDKNSPMFDSITWVKSLYYQALAGSSESISLLEKIKYLIPDTELDFDYNGIWVIKNIRENLINMSDGYQVIISLILDLVRLLCDCYGTQRILYCKDSVIVDYPGVVLIDDLDSHLHASWQAIIGCWLTKHFPRIQFIITTHSPFVCLKERFSGVVKLSEYEKARYINQTETELLGTFSRIKYYPV